jgi:hypothetical protein
MTKRAKSTNPPGGQARRRQPLSLYPLSVEEALKAAMETGPAKPKKPSKPKKLPETDD